ncbi:MAG: hypothetical protein IT303_17530 [Dehalococcoidia bacterium]|nr:hypothetical protein [Dehalococcoidia bacterium]
MSERMTVVFDDTELARRLKVAAAERGVPLKRLIEEAVRAFLGPDPRAEAPAFNWAAFEAWQDEVEAREASDPGYSPDDLSDVKLHLYTPAEPRLGLRVAESPAEYDPRP